jgi:ribonuclease H2 subunit A
MISNWEYSESMLESRQSSDKQFGSGYPSDPVCQAWLERNREMLFGFSDTVRFSWAPIKKALCGDSSSAVVQVEFSLDDDDDEQELRLRKHSLKRQRDNLLGFLKSKRSPFPYFEHKKLRVVSKL